ncbi:MAG: Transcription-repair-coupling factor [Dehalococcoidia bacterium]|nr:Transcription-repair-coupling factor [Bacillota bacterium]
MCLESIIKLHALGGGEWSRAKARVQASVQDLAKELLSLYAARESEPGHQFSPEHPWQKDFEAAFPHEETPDQLQTIREVIARSPEMYALRIWESWWLMRNSALESVIKSG